MPDSPVVTSVGTFRARECSSCGFFDRSLFDGFEAGTGPGFCRRFPPVVFPREGEGRQAFPVVSPWEWCGEWRGIGA